MGRERQERMRGQRGGASVPARQPLVVRGHLPAQVEPAPHEGGDTTYEAAEAPGLSSFAPNKAKRHSRPERSRTDLRRFWGEHGVSGAKQSQSRRPGRLRSQISNLRLSLGDRARGVSSFVRNEPNFSRSQTFLTFSPATLYTNMGHLGRAETKPIWVRRETGGRRLEGWRRGWVKRIAGARGADRMGPAFVTIPSITVCGACPAFGVMLECDWL